MKIIILGAGAIGSLVGGLLSRYNDIILIGRREHVDEINKNGLTINGFVNENFKVKAKTKINKIYDDTLIILTTKAFNSEKTLNDIKKLLHKNNIILCLQNGLGNEDLIKNIVDCEVIRGITTSGATFVKPGKVKCNNIGEIYLENSDTSAEISKIFNRTKLKTRVSYNIKERIWEKLIVNCSINPLTAIFKAKNGKLLESQELIKSIVNELVMVSGKEGLNFNKEEAFDNVMNVIKDSSNNISSMLQDVLKGRKTEIGFLNKKIIEIAKKHHIEVPVNRTLVNMIDFLENQ